MGKDGHQVYKYNLGLTAEERKDAGATLDKLGQYLKVILLLGVETYVFANFKQEEGNLSIYFLGWEKKLPHMNIGL